MKVSSDGGGIQTWSQLPRETLGDWREVGFVHGANRVQSESDFPHNLAEHAYSVGFEYGVSQRSSEAAEYAAGQSGRSLAFAPVSDRREAYDNCRNASERWAFQSGRDFAAHERIHKRS